MNPFGEDGKQVTEAFQTAQKAKPVALVHHVRGELEHAPKLRVIAAELCFEIGEAIRIPVEESPYRHSLKKSTRIQQERSP